MSLPIQTSAAGWRFDNSYARLPDDFHERLAPSPVKEPRLALLNRPLAAALGLDAAALDAEEAAAVLAGNALPPGAEPLAQAYAGHQYGHFTMLGDGRAILLGEQMTPDGQRFDIQLKGSGRTRYSRGGDGRAALGPMLREYLISEFMHAMGIPTTRSLAVVTTGEQVHREGLLPGAVLVRVAASHIRVGTFEWAAATRDPAILQTLAGYTLQRHFPELTGAAQPYMAMFHAIMDRQAALIAQWQACGFIHGVMNTDNMALSGETIDYGPCAFMDAYDPATVFSSIDRHGRYAYESQPGIAHWNLARLAEAMLPLFHDDEAAALEWANEAIQSFPARFQREWMRRMRAKLGLLTEEAEDRTLAEEFLTLLHRTRADFTNAFRALTAGTLPEDADSSAFLTWQARWHARLQRQPQQEVRALMRRSNPAIIPRNHRVEEALAAATQCGDLRPARRLLELLSNPADHTLHAPDFQSPAPPGGPEFRTFCGT